ncbi:transcription initiation factor TFIID subunit A-domain-containing protein [Dioszegia hungarica]|uniref:Transcription initiation factor TFIID subunit A-domain-containing protein n=1 Tax=Dioszegia hungarica TaxID=4972 RepID=A0AA38LTF0_9TREE|nr:transcription initiation factor TFIID subunit A-domain-containing protein [Dioszegia hungarica]KAI9634663.1 transcription initiation factor TFIID subunit A-domain-containing protein [Dioszegia hungarica]
MQVNASTYGPSTDKSDSVLAQAKWLPDAAYDAALREKLAQFQAPVKVGGRSTLMQGFAQGRVMSDVPLERVPDAIRAIAEEADRESMAQKKKEVDPALSSSKKRKIQDVADNVDKGLKIDGEVEHVLLQIGDEHMDIISQVSCNLAKHRKSETVERKDVQLAYGMSF